MRPVALSAAKPRRFLVLRTVIGPAMWPSAHGGGADWPIFFTVMKPRGVNPYLKTKIMTASPEELRLMLYDGAIKFARQAKLALEADDFEASYANLIRAQKIVLELSTSLNHGVDPPLCERLAALYTFIYRKLVDANMNRTVQEIDEALKLLDYERQTWQMLMQKLAGEEGQPGGEPADGARQTAISTWSQSA